MTPQHDPIARPRLCALSFLNTVPLVWGLMHGRQRGLFELIAAVPSECADRLAAGTADIGLVPAIEAARLGLEILPGVGIACRGAVRSILLISKTPFDKIRTLAADSNSRTSVALSQIVLASRYGAAPQVRSHAPDLERMLETADAALLIGDAALRVDPERLPYRALDLGAEWWEMSGLPMVFAVWVARPGFATPGLAGILVDSCREGMANLDAIVHQESAGRNMPESLVREYFERNVVFEIGERERQGMDHFLALVRESGMLESTGRVSA